MSGKETQPLQPLRGVECFGEIIRANRLSRGMTIKALAAASSLSIKSVRKAEQSGVVDRDTLQALATALQTTCDVIGKTNRQVQDQDVYTLTVSIGVPRDRSATTVSITDLFQALKAACNDLQSGRFITGREGSIVLTILVNIDDARKAARAFLDKKLKRLNVKSLQCDLDPFIYDVDLVFRHFLPHERARRETAYYAFVSSEPWTTLNDKYRVHGAIVVAKSPSARRAWAATAKVLGHSLSEPIGPSEAYERAKRIYEDFLPPPPNSDVRELAGR